MAERIAILISLLIKNYWRYVAIVVALGLMADYVHLRVRVSDLEKRGIIAENERDLRLLYHKLDDVELALGRSADRVIEEYKLGDWRSYVPEKDEHLWSLSDGDMRMLLDYMEGRRSIATLTKSDMEKAAIYLRMFTVGLAEEVEKSWQDFGV